MSADAVVVLTSKSLETMISEGGSGNWRAKENRIRRCRWIVAVRNRHSNWSQGPEDHATAFLLGKIAGVKPSPTEAGRLVILFDKYAEIEKPKAWPGNRNPVAYTTLSMLEIDPGNLEWKDFPRFADATTAESKETVVPAAVFEKAKLMIASALSIQPAAIQINIQV